MLKLSPKIIMKLFGNLELRLKIVLHKPYLKLLICLKKEKKIEKKSKI